MDETDNEDRDLIPAKRSHSTAGGAERNYSLAVCLKFGAVYIMKSYDDICPIGKFFSRNCQLPISSLTRHPACWLYTHIWTGD